MADILKIAPNGQWTLEKSETADATLAKADDATGTPKRVVATRVTTPDGTSVPKDEHTGWKTQSISPDYKGDAGIGTQNYGSRVKGMYQQGGLGLKNADLAGGSTMDPLPQWPKASQNREYWFARWGGKKVKGDEARLRADHHREAGLDEEMEAHQHDLTHGKEGSKPINVEFVNIPGIYDQFDKPEQEIPTEVKLDRKTGKYAKRVDTKRTFAAGKPTAKPAEGAAASVPSAASGSEPTLEDIEAASQPGIERQSTDDRDTYKFRRSTHAVHINGVPVGAVTVHHPSKENDEHQFMWHPEVKTDADGKKSPGDMFPAEAMKQAFAATHPDWDGKITPEQENWLKFTLQNRLKHFVTRAGFKEHLKDAKEADLEREALQTGAAARNRANLGIDPTLSSEAQQQEARVRGAEEGGVKQEIAGRSEPNAAAGPRADVQPYQAESADRPIPSAKPGETPNVVENALEGMKAAARTPKDKARFAEKLKALRAQRAISPEEQRARDATVEDVKARQKMATGGLTQGGNAPAPATVQTGRSAPESAADAAARLAPDVAQNRVESISPTGGAEARQPEKRYPGIEAANQKLTANPPDQAAIEAKRVDDKAIIGDAFAKLAPEQQATFRKNPRKMMEWAQSVLAAARK